MEIVSTNEINLTKINLQGIRTQTKRMTRKAKKYTLATKKLIRTLE